jgi:hypothetical protein
MHTYRNNEARSRNHCYRGKTVLHISVCACKRGCVRMRVWVPRRKRVSVRVAVLLGSYYTGVKNVLTKTSDWEEVFRIFFLYNVLIRVQKCWMLENVSVKYKKDLHITTPH